MPAPERILWHKIRNQQLKFRFRRQYAIENRIFDFYAPQIKLAIEIDGDSHFPNPKAREQELKQDAYFFNKYGIKVIRFHNPEVKFSTNDVLEEIMRVIDLLPHPKSTSPTEKILSLQDSPPPLREGGN